MNWWHWFFQRIVEVQREIYLAFADRIGAFAENGDWSLLLVYLPLGIVFGAVHALTPGHSKIVLATYVSGSPTRAWEALRVSLILSTVHVFIAVIIALLALPLVSTALGSAGRAPLLEDISRGMVGLIGAWMIWQVFSQHKGHQHTRYRSTAFAILAGLIPCPLTLFVMTFAIAKQVPEAGVAFAVVMLIGVALTLSAVALGAVLLRGSVLRAMVRPSSNVYRAGQALQALCGIVLVLIAFNALFSDALV